MNQNKIIINIDDTDQTVVSAMMSARLGSSAQWAN